MVEWAIKEWGVEDKVEVINLDMREKREHKSDWFLQINPFGKLPALEDGDLKLAESGAIIVYLGEKYGVLKTPEERARANQWALFANSTMFTSVFVDQWRDRFMPDMFNTLNTMLGRAPYLEGDTFGVADILVGSYLMYIPAFLPQLDLSPYPNVQAYMKRLGERPACAQTMTPQGQPSAPAAKSG